jgi:hypothetical protein
MKKQLAKKAVSCRCLRRDVASARCRFGAMSLRRDVASARCRFGAMSASIESATAKI